MGKNANKLQQDVKIVDLENKWKRALADYHNLEKRVAKEQSDFVRLANCRLIEKILPILDELQICQRHLNDKGLAIILGNFRQVLASEGVEEIKALGEVFDPLFMEAIEVTDGPKDKVAEVVKDGYRLEEKIIRPAKVKVGLGKIKRELK